MSTTPNMNLDLPIPEVTTGPQYANMLVDALETIDNHDHSSGKGPRITPSGLNINANLSFADFLATSVGGVRLTSLGSQPVGGSDLRQLYSYNGELYYRDSAGNAVKITDGGNVNITAPGGGFSGDFGTGTESVPYSSSTKVYSFLQDTGIAAPISAYQLKLLDDSSGSGTITISPPSGTITSHSFILAAALPASQSFMQIDGSGNLSYSNTVPLATTFSADMTLSSDLALTTAGGSGTSATAPRLEINNGDVGDSFFTGFLGNNGAGTNPAGVADALITSSGPTYAKYVSVDQSTYNSAQLIDLTYGTHTFGISSNTRAHTILGALTFSNTYSTGITYGIGKSTSTVLSLYNNANAIVNVGATSVGIAAAATIDFANSAGSYTAPKLLAQNSSADVTGWGVYRNGSSPSGLGALATASNARIYYTADGGTTPLSLINVVAATGVISIGNGTHDSVAHSLSGSLNFGSTAALPTNGIGRSGGNQLSITTGSSERIRVTDTTTTVRGNLLGEGTLTVSGGGATTLSGTLAVTGTSAFTGVTTFSANPAGTIESGSSLPTFTSSGGTSTCVPTSSHYMRVGDTVFVTVNFGGTLDGTGLLTGTFTIPTSRASNFNSVNRAAGTMSMRGSSLVAWVGQVLSTNGAKTVTFIGSGTASNAYTGSMEYSYRLLND